jgi:inward rectifier potassium channel
MAGKRPFRRQQLVQIRNLDGRFEIPGMGAWYTYWSDPYHLFLTIPWWGFVGIIVIIYFLINALFACAYLLGGDCLEGARPGYFSDAFFFSVQTLASIGYGAMHPTTFYANFVVTLEAIVSLLLVAVVTGIAFARFSHPKAKVLFSDRAIIAPYNGVPTLMFRIANERRNTIVEAQLQVYILVDEVTTEGQFMRRVTELKMIRQRTPALSLTWTAMHAIAPDSPLYGHDPASLLANNAQLQVSIIGIDEAVAYTIHARHTYATREILYDHRFVDIVVPQPNGDRYIDYRYFHSTFPIPVPGGCANDEVDARASSKQKSNSSLER